MPGSAFRLCAVALCCVRAAAASAQTPVFINEIHYDNMGEDIGEAIEVAGPAGTDVTNWSIVLYNGMTGASYETLVLAGLLPDQAAGFGFAVVATATNGIQNGPADGVALVDDIGLVSQFLSYEGTFQAVGGPANGLFSTDLDVAEDNATTSIGASLQLAGMGSMAEDFGWTAPQPNTFGLPNVEQSFVPEPTGAAGALAAIFALRLATATRTRSRRQRSSTDAAWIA